MNPDEREKYLQGLKNKIEENRNNTKRKFLLIELSISKEKRDIIFENFSSDFEIRTYHCASCGNYDIVIERSAKK